MLLVYWIQEDPECNIMNTWGEVHEKITYVAIVWNNNVLWMLTLVVGEVSMYVVLIILNVGDFD